MLKNRNLTTDDAPLPATIERASTTTIPAVIADEGPKASERFFTFFTDTIRNKNTRAAYYRNARRFFDWRRPDGSPSRTSRASTSRPISRNSARPTRPHPSSSTWPPSGCSSIG